MTSELYYLDAVDILTLYRKKKLSPIELMQSIINRSENINPSINALTEQFYCEAIKKAADLEKDFFNQHSVGPLAGIPITAKEKHPIAGKEITHGLNLHSIPIASESHTLIDRIEQAGGIIISRSTTPEFSCATFTQSTSWGITRNPYNHLYSPGGSSGGSAAALAAGMATLATASDIGGSARLPASFTGIVGYKPPYGKIPGMGPLAADHYRSDGPLARSIQDVALLTNIMAGIDRKDHSSLPDFSPLPLQYSGDLKGKRIALSITLGNYDVSPDIEQNTRKIAYILEEAGAIVEEIDFPWKTEEIMEIASIHYANILVPGLKKELEYAESSADYIDAFIKLTLSIAGNRSYFDALQGEYKIQQDLASTLSEFDALITPASAIPGLIAGESYLDGITMPSGKYHRHYWEAHMAVPFNIANRLPVLSVPSGMADCGIPTGIQIVGNAWDEHTVFEIGAAIEKIQPWRQLWKKITS